MTRWATFDCYGTLIDWDAGISTELERLFRGADIDYLLTRYHDHEREVQREDPTRTYRAVLKQTLMRVAYDAGLQLERRQTTALSDALPKWQAFREVTAALEQAAARGWRLAILSNSDPDFIEASIRQIGVTFNDVVVASDIGSYKPAHRHWGEFFRRTGARPDKYVHVAASLFHDITPARELGLQSIWINRQGDLAAVEPTRELPDLKPLPETLDELVPR